MTKPVLHYFDVHRLGRGEVIRLLLIDAGLEYDDRRYPLGDTWPAQKELLKAKNISRSGKLPVLEHNGHALNQHVPILRYLAQDLGAYDGEDSHQKYLVDAVADIYVDWRFEWVAHFFAPSERFINETAPQYYDLLDGFYTASAGPYLLGERITYADILVYQSMYDDEGTKSLPVLPESLRGLREAFEARPRIAAYIKEVGGR